MTIATPQHQQDPSRLLPVAREQLYKLVKAFSNPFNISTPAHKINGLLHDPIRAQELTRDMMMEQLVKAEQRGRVLTVALVKTICRRVSKETIITRACGIPATLIRQGCRYEKLRLELRGGDDLGHPELSDEDIWDRAAHNEAQRQAAALAAGTITTVRWPPLHDGTSTRPHNPHGEKLACGGLAEWREAIANACALHVQYEWDDRVDTDERSRMSAEQEWEQATWTPDATWLADHGITADMIRAIPEQRLRDAGVDPTALAMMAGCSMPSRRVDTVNRVVQDRMVAERMVAAYRGRSSSSDAILTSYGLPVRVARTMLAYASMLAEHDVEDGSVEAQALWDETCDRLNRGKRRRGCMPGRAGRLEAQRVLAEWQADMRSRFTAVAQPVLM